MSMCSLLLNNNVDTFNLLWKKKLNWLTVIRTFFLWIDFIMITVSWSANEKKTYWSFKPGEKISIVLYICVITILVFVDFLSFSLFLVALGINFNMIWTKKNLTTKSNYPSVYLIEKKEEQKSFVHLLFLYH
mgnify:CR=1 FL=1